MGEDKQLYVAIFRNHPLGPRRFAKDFRGNLTYGDNNMWWRESEDSERRRHFKWALNHEQFHYSTDDLNQADFFYCDEHDAEDRAILEKYAPVDYFPVKLEMQ